MRSLELAEQLRPHWQVRVVRCPQQPALLLLRREALDPRPKAIRVVAFLVASLRRGCEQIGVEA
jgi:hypothetical protein